MPIYIMCTARGCLGYKQDDKEKNEYGENIGKFAKLFEYFGTILFIFRSDRISRLYIVSNVLVIPNSHRRISYGGGA